MLIVLAGLQNIARELYQAAIDGAGGWRRFVPVTLLHLRNTTTVVVTVTIFALRHGGG